MKICISCHKEKEGSEFHANGNGKLKPDCKECRNTYLRDRKKKQKEGLWHPTHKKRPHEYSDTTKASRSPTTNDLYWAAGFLDGEGWFRKGSALNVGANQKDPECLYKLQEIFGGNIFPAKGENIHTWNAYGMRAHGIMMTFYSLLSSRRQKQILEALSKYRAKY